MRICVYALFFYYSILFFGILEILIIVFPPTSTGLVATTAYCSYCRRLQCVVLAATSTT